MIRLLIFIAIILSAFISLGASVPRFEYPVIAAAGTSMNDFIPQGWSSIDIAYGEINNDHSTDMAFIIQYKDRVPEYFIVAQGDTVMEDAQPRILVVILKDKVTGKYSLALQNNNFVLRAAEVGMTDPLYKLSLDGGSLNIGFKGGRSDKWELDYKFSYNAGEWHLVESDNKAIGYDEKTEDWHFDFVSGKASHITGAVENKEVKVESVPLAVKELKTFKTLLRPLTWQVFEDVYL